MPANLTIHLHCLCLNNAALLPHFFRHYDSWVSTFHVWDRGSTDGTREWLAQHPKVVLHDATPSDASDPLQDKLWFDSAWKISQGQADWVVLVRPNELLHHPHWSTYLNQCREEDVTAIRGIGFELVTDTSPEALSDAPLLSQITQGCRSAMLDRLCIFAPNELADTHFSPGLQQAWPRGHVVWPHDPQVLLLSIEVLGNQPGRPSVASDVWPVHANNLRTNARPVPGLGALAHMPPGEFRHDEKTINFSGLFDAQWYLAQYPDVQAQHVDPLVHFTHYGWKEGRQPNPYFDTDDYSRRLGDSLEQVVNPLLHYIEHGEAQGLAPSVHFDTSWYRTTHDLPLDESPLQHYLLRRQQGRVSPKPNFDVAAHVHQHPNWADTEPDPYLHHLAIRQLMRGVQATHHRVNWASMLAEAGIETPAGTAPASVGWAELLAVVRQWVPLLPFDEHWYCMEYPDVAAAVANGDIPSAHDHFISNGFFEGRNGIDPSTT